MMEYRGGYIFVEDEGVRRFINLPPNLLDKPFGKPFWDEVIEKAKRIHEVLGKGLTSLVPVYSGDTREDPTAIRLIFGKEVHTFWVAAEPDGSRHPVTTRPS